MKRLTLDAYWMGRDVAFAAQLTDEIRANAALTVQRANALLRAVGDDRTRGVASGWRPRAVNAAVRGAAPRSNHLTGRAIDIVDDDGSLDAWCMAHLDVLEEIGLWLEHPRATPRWCHVQTVPPRSGRRVFLP